MRDVVESITDGNFKSVRRYLLNNGSKIDDENESYNTSFSLIMEDTDPETYESLDLSDLSADDYKKRITDLFDTYGLNDVDLLTSFMCLASTTRWGYDRDSENASSSEFDIDEATKTVAKIHDVMAEIGITREKYKIMAIVSQDTG